MNNPKSSSAITAEIKAKIEQSCRSLKSTSKQPISKERIKEIASILKASSKQLKVVENVIGKYSYKDIAMAVNDLSQEIKSNPDNPKAQKYNELLMLFTMLLKDASLAQRERDLMSVNIDIEKERFIRQCSKSVSKVTKDSYSRQIDNFRNWARDNYDKDIHYLTKVEAEQYLNYLILKPAKNGNGKKLANHSVNTYLIGVRAFFSYLHERHKFIEKVFDKLNYPPAENDKPINIPSSDKEVKIIMNHLYNGDRGTSLIAMIVELSFRTGFRVGAFETLSVDSNGNFTIDKTKGHKFSGNFKDYDCTSSGKSLFKGVWKQSIMDLIQSKFGTIRGRIRPFADIKSYISNNISRNFLGHTGRLCAAKKIEFSYSIHDLRHYFAHLYYKKSGHDVVLLMKLLSHKLLNTTYKYIQNHGLDRRSNKM